MLKYSIAVFPILLYIFIACIFVMCRTTDYKMKWGSNDLHVDEICRDATPLDVWIGVFWPFFVSFNIIMFLLKISHIMFAHLLLMFFVKYIKTDMYRKVNNKLDIWK